MRLHSLTLTNIGPFDEASIEFLADGDTSGNVTLLTGANGTGKTIILDAIRTLFGSEFATVERDIWRKGAVGGIRGDFSEPVEGRQSRFSIGVGPAAPPYYPVGLSVEVATNVGRGAHPPPWVVDFWRSQLANDAYAITSLAAINHRALFKGALQGVSSNASVTQLLCHFDYLRDSRNARERATGEALYALAQKIVQMSLLDGELKEIERLTFTPIVRQGGHDVPLASISSGNAYLVQRMITLLGRMYSLHVLRDGDPAKLHEASGLLLIDEAENHLHPSWQKSLLPNVREVFPNLQIIAATHSPFVVASVRDARVYVCHYDPTTRRTTVREETAIYQNKPVDEILMSPAFDQTAPFGEPISTLLADRRLAMAKGDVATRDEIERRLVDLNPTYFGYLDLDRKIEALRKAG
ncbi:MAG: AAA family ATPase [Polyangiales bacterium]